MTIYDELIERLRHPWGYNGLISELTADAADAIEELQKIVNNLLTLYDNSNFGDQSSNKSSTPSSPPTTGSNAVRPPVQITLIRRLEDRW